jgi:hypothetical protein
VAKGRRAARGRRGGTAEAQKQQGRDDFANATLGAVLRAAPRAHAQRSHTWRRGQYSASKRRVGGGLCGRTFRNRVSREEVRGWG